jgi:hypothetical protein
VTHVHANDMVASDWANDMVASDWGTGFSRLPWDPRHAVSFLINSLSLTIDLSRFQDISSKVSALVCGHVKRVYTCIQRMNTLVNTLVPHASEHASESQEASASASTC